MSGYMRLVGTGESPKAVCGHIARDLLKLAFDKSLSKDGTTPFALAASEELNMAYSGGKQDDITVVVGMIEEGHDQHAIARYSGVTMDSA